MNDKIKPYIPWINIGLIFLVLFLIEYLYNNVLNVRIGGRPYYSFLYPVVMPALEVARYITMETITWFGGGEYPFVELVKTAAISAAGLAALFILAPWFFAKGLLHRNPENQPSGFTWYIGTIIIILGIAISSIYGVRQTISNLNNSNQRSIESSRMADQLRTYMANVAFDASEWWILPDEKGGGNGSFIDGDGNPLSLNRLGSYDPGHPDFVLSIGEVPSDSVMILNGAMMIETDEGETERRFSIEISPADDSLFRFM